MKLVEILAKVLKEWPECRCICQDNGFDCYSWTDTPIWKDRQWCVTHSAHVVDRVECLPLADDYQTAIVTKEMWEAEKAKLNVQNTPVKAESFNPIYCRDRIKEIDALVGSLEEERVSLVQALEDEGFSLIERINKQLEECKQSHEDMSDWQNWKRGDLIECVDGSSGAYTKGRLYVFIEISEWGSVRCTDDRGGENGIPPEGFKWHSRPQIGCVI